MRTYKPFNEDQADFKELLAGQAYMQGDVVLTKTNADLSGMKKISNPVLAEGEAQNHCHMIVGEDNDFEIYEDKEKNKYVWVKNVCFLKHQEHKKIKIGPGIYRTGIQTEYDHFEKNIRRVMD